MAVESKRLDVDRDVYEISYDTDACAGETISAKFENADDVSVYTGSNDGKFIVTVAKGYEGSDTVTVAGSQGGTDSGTVHFG